jgi:OmpA-OmpF porin, OOP family
MKTGYRVSLVALVCAGALVVISPAIAQNATDTPSQQDIVRQLKTRGLPTFGPSPAPSTTAVTPANAPSAPHASAGTYRAAARVSRAVAPANRPSVTFRTITFEFGSAQLRPEAVATLRNLGNALNQDLKDEKAFVIEGHTDRTGTQAYNDELSKERADAVKDYLVNNMRVSADRLRTVGKGFSEPIDPRRPYAPANRRVVVVNAGAS